MPKHTNKITNKFGCAEPERENLKGSNSEDKYSGQRETNPRGRNSDSSNDDYKENPHNLWALGQRQLSNSNPKSEPKPWPTNDGSQKPSWLPAHPVEKALQCVKWAPGSWCNHTKSLRYQTSTKIRYQLQVSQKMPLWQWNTQMPEQAPPVDGNDNVNPPPVGRINKGVICIDDDVQPYYEYFTEGNSIATTEGSYLGSEESNMLDDDGH